MSMLKSLLTKEIIGRITERLHCYKGEFMDPVTAYTVEGIDGRIYRGIMDGHRSSPEEGKYVRMRLKRWQAILGVQEYEGVFGIFHPVEGCETLPLFRAASNF